MKESPFSCVNQYGKYNDKLGGGVNSFFPQKTFKKSGFETLFEK